MLVVLHALVNLKKVLSAQVVIHLLTMMLLMIVRLMLSVKVVLKLLWAVADAIGLLVLDNRPHALDVNLIIMNSIRVKVFVTQLIVKNIS